MAVVVTAVRCFDANETEVGQERGLTRALLVGECDDSILIGRGCVQQWGKMMVGWWPVSEMKQDCGQH